MDIDHVGANNEGQVVVRVNPNMTPLDFKNWNKQVVSTDRILNFE